MVNKHDLLRGLQFFNPGVDGLEMDETLAFLADLGAPPCPCPQCTSSARVLWVGVDDSDSDFDYEYFLTARALQLREYFPGYDDDFESEHPGR